MAYTVRVGRENVTSQEMCDTFPTVTFRQVRPTSGRTISHSRGGCPSSSPCPHPVAFLEAEQRADRKVYCIVASIREPGATVYHRVAVYSIATVLAMNSTAENGGGDAVKIFAEGDPKVLIAYFLAFGIWTGAAANDSSARPGEACARPVEEGRFISRLHSFRCSSSARTPTSST